MALPLLLLVFFVGEWFYPVLFEVFWRGQTLGKRVVGLRVIHDDGTPIAWSASLLRNLLLSADLIPGTFLAGLVSSLTSSGRRRLGDHAAGTLVVHTASSERASRRAPARAPTAELPARPPPIALALEEQRAVMVFGERMSELSPERADELARLAAPLVEAEAAPAQALRAIAAWLRGAERPT